MPELGALREAEEYAEKIVEQAAKDAQKTLLGLPSRLEEMNCEKEARLRAVATQAQTAVEAEMKELRGKLDSESERRLALLETRRPDVEAEALKKLRERILHGGAEG